MWTIFYHPDVEADLKSLGNTAAKRILKTIDEKIIHGEPDKTGKPLRNKLSGCRRLRVGNTRIIYKVHKDSIEIFILAVGPRRNDEIYQTASKRT